MNKRLGHGGLLFLGSSACRIAKHSISFVRICELRHRGSRLREALSTFIVVQQLAVGWFDGRRPGRFGTWLDSWRLVLVCWPLIPRPASCLLWQLRLERVVCFGTGWVAEVVALFGSCFGSTLGLLHGLALVLKVVTTVGILLGLVGSTVGVSCCRSNSNGSDNLVV